MRRFLPSVLGAFVLSLLLAPPSFGQGVQSGGITGVVKDPAGAVVAKATVELFEEKTGNLARRITAGEDGSFAASLLPPGTYRLEVTAAGFKQYRAGIPVRIYETTRHDVTLEIGAVEERVVVEAAPTLINTTNPTTGQPVDSETLAALPMAVPNYMLLLGLSTGVSGEPADVRSANRGNVDFTVHGQRTTNNSMTLEGVNVNDFNLAHFDTVPLPNPSTIQEFKVSTSLYDASVGTKGGGAVNVVLKSGTKDVHGEVYWFHRNDKLNANEWFRNRDGAPRARLLQNVLGVSGSGPVWKLGGFWFVNVHGVRARNGLDPSGSTVSAVLPRFPTAADGTTSAALLATEPRFGLTPGQIDPIAVNILNLNSNLYGGTFLIPRLSQGGCATATAATATAVSTYRCSISAVAPLEDTQFTINYDRSLRQGKDKLAVRWFYDQGEVSKPYGTAAFLAFPRADFQRNRFFSVSHQHTIGRHINEFRFGYNRFNSSFAPSDPISLSDIGATRPNAGSVPGIYFFSITGLFSLGTGVNDERGTVSNTFQVSDNWSLSWGKHTFRAGGEVIRYQLNRFNRFANRGALTFGATTTAGTGANSPFANFLQGRLTAIQSAAGDPQRYFRATDLAFYFQDDWRIHPRFTLNLGLRWEGMGFSHDKFLVGGIYDPALMLQTPPQNPFLFAEGVSVDGFRGTPGVSSCALEHCLDSNNFAPRLGFAWDLFGDQKTVLRGGYGIYFQRLSNQNLLQGSLAAPFFVQLIDTRSPAIPFQLQNPLGAQPPSAGIAGFVPQLARFAGLRRLTTAGCAPGPLDPNDPCVAPNFVNTAGQLCANFGGTAANCVINLASFATSLPDAHAPYTQQWNLSLQRELGSGWGVELAYVGSHYLGGLAIFNPFMRLASPANPIGVTDINGVSYTITRNTVNNEPLRHAVLGLSRARGARFDANIGTANYHSGQITVSHRFSGGLYFQGAYTFSKTIDNVSGSLSTDELNATRSGQGGANILNNQSDPRQNRARGDFDRPHRLILSYTWEIPVPKQGLWGSQGFQGWSVSGIVSYQSGLPFSLEDSNSGNAFGTRVGTGLLICRAAQDPTLPTCTPGAATTVEQARLSGSVQSRLGHYFNPNFISGAVIVPNGVALPNGTGIPTGFGNVPRNAFRGPSQQNWDFSIAKKFTIGERHSFVFRTDFFNLWNHPVFRAPSRVDVANPATLGQILETAVPARLIQFGLKYYF